MKQMWSKEEIETQKKDISTLVDSKENPRFVEGDGVGLTQEGVTITYCKWSLSGTHLMLVCAGTITKNTAISVNTTLANYKLPAYIMNKVYPVFAVNIIEYKQVDYRQVDGWTSQSAGCFLDKYSAGLRITSSGITATDNRGFRIQYDLLIDNE